MRQKRISSLRVLMTCIWLIILLSQDGFCIASMFGAWQASPVVVFATIIPTLFSLPLLVLSAFEFYNRTTLINNLLAFTVSDIIMIIIYTLASFVWSVFAFTIAAFAEGYGTLPIAMTINTFYIFILPVMSLIFIIVYIVLYRSSKKTEDGP